MSLFEAIDEIFPEILSETTTQSTRLGLEDSEQMLELLHDRTLLTGLLREWRKAIFRILDCGFTLVGITVGHTRKDLDDSLSPFTEHYALATLKNICDNGHISDTTKSRLTQYYENILLKTSGRSNWPLRKALAQSLPAFRELDKIFGDICVALQESQELEVQWIKLWRCLRIADTYDMCRRVYQSLESQELSNGLSALTKDELGEILDLWQFVIDNRIGDCRKLKTALFTTARETATLPKSMILPGVALRQRDAVHGGGCADIYMGDFKDNVVALKSLRVFDKDEIDAILQDVFKEAIVWRQLKHKNIAQFLGLCSETIPNRITLVSPWMNNGDLASFLKRNREVDRLSIAAQVASGVAYLHSQNPQVIHGDLRASNILIDENQSPRITDFGISVVNIIKTRLSKHVNRGSYRWQAPELHYSADGLLGHPTTKSDVYALGMTCYEIFTGSIPFSELPEGAIIIGVCRDGLMPSLPAHLCIQANSVEEGTIDRTWNLLTESWNHDPRKRPTAEAFESTLKLIIAMRSGGGTEEEECDGIPFESFIEDGVSARSSHNPEAPSNEIRDHHIACRGCDKNIVGVRFQCASCPSDISGYNLCDVCEAKSYVLHNPTHIFFKFKRPVDMPIKSSSSIVPSNLYREYAVPRTIMYASNPKAYLEGILHPSTLCDFCVERIVGEWFHCVYCSIDLCNVCEKKVDHNRTHFFMVLKARVNMRAFREFTGFDKSEVVPPIVDSPVYTS